MLMLRLVRDVENLSRMLNIFSDMFLMLKNAKMFMEIDITK